MATKAFPKEGLTVCFSQSNCYIGRFIGLAEAMQEWLAPIIANWVLGVNQLVAVTANYPQTANMRLVVSLQAE